MAKLNTKRFLLTTVTLLVCVAFVNLTHNVYSAITPIITEDEQAELREERYALGHCPAPEPEELEVSVEEAKAAYLETQTCVSDTSIASSIKSTNKMMSGLRDSGGVKQPYEKQEKPNSSPCSKSDKKVLAEQARYGAQTEGLMEGKDGAETTANREGSTAQYALMSQNLQICHEQKLAEMSQVGPSFNLYCKENPDECSQSASHWLAPVAVVQASLGFRNFSQFHAKRIENLAAAAAESAKVEARGRQERATYEQYNYLYQALATMADKEQEIRAKNKIMMEAVDGTSSGGGLKRKFQQGGVGHEAITIQ